MSINWITRARITSATVLMAGLTITLVWICNVLLDRLLYSAFSSVDNVGFVLRFTTFGVYLFGFGLPVFFPFFWAWQNYKAHRKWWFFFIASLASILYAQVFLAVVVLVLFLIQKWQDFLQRSAKVYDARSIL